jgi:hypothetical protein
MLGAVPTVAVSALLVLAAASAAGAAIAEAGPESTGGAVLQPVADAEADMGSALDLIQKCVLRTEAAPAGACEASEAVSRFHAAREAPMMSLEEAMSVEIRSDVLGDTEGARTPTLLERQARRFGLRLESQSPYWVGARRWPRAVVPVAFAPGVDDVVKNRLAEALSMIESKTCVRFFETAQDYVQDQVSVEPASEVVCVTWGLGAGSPRRMTLHPSCRPGTIAHELLHALGFKHTHQRPDRDRFVEYSADACPDDYRPQYSIASKGYAVHTGHDYEYDSILHYGFNECMRPREQPFQAAGEPRFQREELKPGDVLGIRRQFGCYYVSVQRGRGEPLAVDVHPDQTVAELKRRLEDMTGVPRGKQTLYKAKLGLQERDENAQVHSGRLGDVLPEGSLVFLAVE